MHRMIALCLGLSLAGQAAAGESASTLASTTDVNVGHGHGCVRFSWRS
jgi:hypothetical protein